MAETEETAAEIEEPTAEIGADTPREKHGEIEIETPGDSSKAIPNASTMNQIITLRLTDHLTIKEISDQVGIPQATVGRILKGIGTTLIPSEAENSQSPPAAGSPPSPQQVMLPPQTYQAQQPQDFPVIPADRLAYFYKKDMKSSIAELLRENAMLRQQNSQLASGNPNFRGASFHPDKLKDAMAQAVEIANWQKITQSQNRQNDGALTTKDLLPYLFGKQQNQGGMFDFMKVMGEMQKQQWEFNAKQMNIVESMRPQQMSDETRLKMLELQQNYEQKNLESARELKKWDTIKEMVNPFVPIAGQLLGENVGRAVNPGSTNIECSNCHRIWSISTKAKTAKCPECGTVINPEFFMKPGQFKCQKCGKVMQINAKNLQEIIDSGNSDVKAKCPKCGHISELTLQQPGEAPPQPQTAPPETPPPEEEPATRRPKVHYT